VDEGDGGGGVAVPSRHAAAPPLTDGCATSPSSTRRGGTIPGKILWSDASSSSSRGYRGGEDGAKGARLFVNPDNFFSGKKLF
jgi:hypothetical protein